MKLYADENFPFRTIKKLRNLGHDVLTAFEDERANQQIADADVLTRATELGRTILTFDRQDFKRLHFKNSIHTGIIICTDDADRLRLAQRIDEKLKEFENLEGELIRIYRPDK